MGFLLFTALATVASAKDFLHPEVKASVVENALLAELSAQADDSRLRQMEGDMLPMYLSLPKNAHGRLDPPSVRYALHRYFMQKHGWYVNGLGPAGKGNGTSTTTIMKERAPAFIQTLFEQRLHGQGLNQHDLAVFAATLTDLIHSEVVGSLQDAYETLRLPMMGPVTAAEHRMATVAYLIAYLSGGSRVVATADQLLSVESEWREDFPAWEDTVTWAADMEATLEFLEKAEVNPFEAQLHSFGKHVAYLQDLGHRLGTFQNLDCRKLKDQLVEIEDLGTGRVPLSRFYRGGLEDGDWTFTESVEFLRHIGALDETNPNRMSVVIPNYLQSQSHCLAGSSFYSICCLDECEGLMKHVEGEIQRPLASPLEVAAVIRSLHSDTVQAPRNLSEALLGRLEEIAEIHGGSIPLHGRLFAQWMHHAYPRECPFPHVIGASDRLSPDEWSEAMDIESPMASEEEMLLLLEQGDSHLIPELQGDSLPWATAEELVAGHMAIPTTQTVSTSMQVLRAVAVSFVLMSVFKVRFRTVETDSSKVARCLV